MLNKRSHPLIPSYAQCVFSGVRSEVYQWDQKMYDGSIACFERIRFLDGAFVVPILENGNILLTQQEQPARKPFISLPGGAIELFDSEPIANAKRELLEETGATSDEWKSWFTFTGTAHAATFVDYFIARNCKITSSINPDGWEKIELFEVSFDEFLELSSDPDFHHHWNLLPILYEARLNKEKYKELYNLFYN